MSLLFNNSFSVKPLIFAIAASSTLWLTGCGDADTTINEREPIAAEDEHDHGDDDHDHDHGDDDHDHGGEPGGVSAGRLLIINPDENDTEALVYDAADGDLLSTIELTSAPSAMYATAGYRFGALLDRTAGTVSFIDGGLWQEPHDDHFDLIKMTPSLSSYALNGSRPTHFVAHEGQVALFFDGNADAGSNASAHVFTDHMIEENEDPITVEFSMSMHGVAEPRGEHLLASIRRDDNESTSGNKVLPDQVGVYHLHDGTYALEQTFDVTCPDLHGAAQNEMHIVFGCGDGVLLVTDNGDDTYSAEKILNSDDVAENLRVGNLWGHHESGQFIVQASSRDVDTVQFFAIDPVEGEMELIDWQPMPNAKPVTQNFSYEAEQFVILDDQGHLTVIEPHDEGDHTHWEYGATFSFMAEDADVSEMPMGMKFSMTLAQNSHTAYIADPIAQHIRVVDLELLQVLNDIELDYAPAMVTWLGVGEEHDHDHDD